MFITNFVQICQSTVVMNIVKEWLLIILLFFSACSSTRHTPKTSEISRLKFLSEYTIPYDGQFDNTTIGGLSGIDYNFQKNIYYLVSDDRSAKNPARFYTAQILIHQSKIDSVIFIKTTFLKDQLGNFYPNSLQDPYHTPDPEALRYNLKSNHFTWSSEGERIINPQKTVLQNPAVTEINSQGNYLDTFQLPLQLQVHATDNGPRKNGVFEGLTFDDHYQHLYVSVEEPLYEDGPRAGIKDSTGMARIVEFNIHTKKAIAQYAYTIDAVAHPPIPSSGFKINGISDILWIGNKKLLVIERSYSTGRPASTIKVFLADLSSAENIQKISSLKNKPDVKMVTKKLLLNMDDLGFYIDNIEGVTFGPSLSNGNKTLIFIADNNFSPLEKTQFLLFEVEN